MEANSHAGFQVSEGAIACQFQLAFNEIPRYIAGIRNVSGTTMSTVVAEIEAKIRSLSLEDKTELTHALIAELNGPGDPGVERGWLAEAQRRHREVVEGKAQ